MVESATGCQECGQLLGVRPVVSVLPRCGGSLFGSVAAPVTRPVTISRDRLLQAQGHTTA